ncbi:MULTISPECIES: LacI family DNA-binding transcriptional regulator [Streptomyces]|uniref:LacI family DNA-binding transcriptional regulator n=1 Tax=Streptomyces glycanivorans TaxID=3033808 RepID=A0ABY9JH04_9ACTN|nr:MULTISPECIES: LacI family DNA-binding transcriptional regulator [unclassified Streptomyces]WSQ79690.1 LacI family transcriptional regulator [Streptomyces sp. NBC_01213]WLQ66244.1 LacI family DNA-binding transcriptional regulator [Streptomyces sp. Alt3]WSQ87070.1 LacI family transcriptional regulator [Streptomyces sp. NBC_01212]WSR06914.1 LacI family transcriptional regulator [Streptomyces sp. NBC_01208]WSR50347.1 LacI family transcriptional regulator [Streptomyces sp. NBC_01201]
MTKRRLSQVAEYAGVSVATVGRVLNGSPDVASTTREAVLSALDVCGIERPSRYRAERAALIGLVVPDLQNPIFSAFAEALCGLLNKRGLIPVLCTRTADGVSEAHYIEMLLKQNIGGIVFIGASYADAGPEHGRALRERKVPMVLLNAADENAGVAQVRVDDTLAADQALTHLAALGHERIGMVLGPVGHVPSARKLAGFAAFCARRGIAADEWRRLVAHALFTMEGGATALPRLLAEGVTGIVCASDALALGVIRGARRQGVSVPQDLSVVGFDDSPFMVATDPPLTTARQPIQAMASAVVSSLVAQIDGHAGANELLMFDTELIVRRSTAARPH